MQIERNLSNPLRSLIEKLVENHDPLSSSSMLVDKDKNQAKQEKQNTKTKEDGLLEDPVDENQADAKDLAKPGLVHRLDLIA